MQNFKLCKVSNYQSVHQFIDSSIQRLTVPELVEGHDSTIQRPDSYRNTIN